ncbi:hypothetical protein Q7P35_003292 [Cladosporium inversicolor]
MTIHRPRHSLRRLQSLLTPSPNSSRDSSPPENNTNNNETSGLAWIILGAAEHASTTCEINAVINDLLAPALLQSPGITLLWHLHNTNPNARSGTLQTAFTPLNGGCCASQCASTTSTRKKQCKHSELSPRGSIPAEHFGAHLKGYELIQHFEPPKLKGRPAKGKCVVAVGIEPACGDEEALDRWYRSEQLDLMAQNPIFVRCTRYRLLGPTKAKRTGSETSEDGEMTNASSGEDEAPRFLALHEYESHQALLDHAIEHGQMVPETPMSKRIFDSARKVERAIWEVDEDYR